ncbi:NADH:flavin oxidoreductase [uncultured Clostridium sp.]|uniref:NADH:flavin oxidoreductase n=1 Tax=uncultured Clostridium sp. TaxID=59620 RepID=UPI002631F033|nr:NADH:flavin oxidoreductase [uncultured Clostridium sp.]
MEKREMKLFEKATVGNLQMKNKFIRGALWTALADEKGHITDEITEVYEELAKGGVGTIITGYAFVTENEQPNPRMLGIYNDSFIDEYKKFTDMIHSYDANIIMQIVYGGFMTEFNVGERVILGPSTAKNEVTGTMAREITKDEIKWLIKKYADAAVRVKKAGFDGVEIHCGHGYLLSQFLSPYYNKRTDEFGGSIENRGRIVFEIFEAMRNAVGKDFPIWIKLNSADYVDGGLTEEDSMYVAETLSKMGIDAVEVTGGNESIKYVAENNLGAARTKVVMSKDKESYFKNYAIELSKRIDASVILIGGNRHLDVLSDIYENSNIKAFTLSRPLTCQPDLINKWMSGEVTNPKCVSCNMCYNTYGKRCIFNIKK